MTPLLPWLPFLIGLLLAAGVAPRPGAGCRLAGLRLSLVDLDPGSRMEKRGGEREKGKGKERKGKRERSREEKVQRSGIFS